MRLPFRSVRTLCASAGALLTGMRSERSEDNLFTWVIELLGFDPKLPLSLYVPALQLHLLMYFAAT